MSAESDAHDRVMREHGDPVSSYMYMDAMESRLHYMDTLEHVLSVPGVRTALEAHTDDIALAHAHHQIVEADTATP